MVMRAVTSQQIQLVWFVPKDSTDIGFSQADEERNTKTKSNFLKTK